jgi:glycosyltransferase involved in cell wall biosynthesis
MRVLFDTYPWAFDRPGGGEIQLLHYARALPALGVEVLLHDLWQPAYDRVELVHFFSTMGGSVHLCGYLHRRGLPLVVSASLWLSPETRHLYPLGEIRDQLSLARAVVTNSHAESERLASLLGLPRERLHVVRNGIDDRFAEPVPAALFAERTGIAGPFVLNVGNLEPRKNQLRLARAVRRLGLPLVLIGHLRDPAYAAEVLGEGGPGLRHLGALAHDDPLLRAAYAACAVFALPSTLETPGLAALEAAACGARLVVTEEGSTREYFGDEALYVQPEDVDGIAAALAAALEAPPQKGLGSRIARDYRWSAAGAELKAVYQAVLAGGGR